MKNKIFIGVLIILALGIFFAYSMLNNMESQNKVLVIGREGDAISLDPSVTTDSESFQITSNVLETLVKYSPSGTELEPGLAEDWTISEDGLKWIFKIRKNVEFHDGSELNAEVVAFNFDRWMNQESPYHTGKFTYWDQNFEGEKSIVRSVTPLSDYTLEVILNEPYAPFINALSMPAFAISSSDAILKYNENLKLHPVGTGPFAFESWEKDQAIILKRFDKYWGDKAKVNQVIFKVIGEDEDAVSLLESGEVHIIDHLSSEEAEALSMDSEHNVVYKPFFNIGYMVINNSMPPFDNLEVRQAIAHLVDKEKMANSVLNSMSRPAQSFLPPLLFGYHEGIESESFDLEKAKALLASAGYESGFETTLWVMDSKRDYLTNPMEIAEYLKGQLSLAGINVEIRVFEWDEYLDRIQEGKHGIALAGWNGDIVDPDNFLYTFFSSNKDIEDVGFNYSFYKNGQVDGLLNKARRVSDLEFRNSLYREVQEIIHSQVPAIPLMHTMNAVGINNRVINYTPQLAGHTVLNNVELLED